MNLKKQKNYNKNKKKIDINILASVSLMMGGVSTPNIRRSFLVHNLIQKIYLKKINNDNIKKTRKPIIKILLTF
jgi:hypothetical protein